jgi:hypothetical protein
MPPPNKKIRLTFLWADEAVARQDLADGYSAKLVEWANAFYGRFGFELEVDPPVGTSLKDAARYCLEKSNGYEPDYTTAREFEQRLLKEKLPTLREWWDADQRVARLIAEEAAKRQQVSAAVSQFAALPSSQWTALASRITILLGELQTLVNDLAAQRKRHQDAQAKLDQIDLKHAAERKARDFDAALRERIGAKVLRSFPIDLLTGIKTGQENPGVVDARRLKIVICNFRLGTAQMMKTMRPTPHPFGLTFYPGTVNSEGGRYLWDGHYIAVNLARREQITLAHEIVHAAGRHHRQDFDRMKDLRDWVRSIKSDPVTGKIVFPPIFERVDGGYYDGPEDDIMNYNSKGKDPDKVQLYPADVARMENAFFVRQP